MGTDFRPAPTVYQLNEIPMTSSISGVTVCQMQDGKRWTGNLMPISEKNTGKTLQYLSLERTCQIREKIRSKFAISI